MRRLLALLVLMTACGPAEPKTVADACYIWSSTLCDKAVECGTLTGGIGQCRSDGVDACCAKSDCGLVMNEAATRFTHDCDAALRAMTCGQFAAGLMPKACAAP